MMMTIWCHDYTAAAASDTDDDDDDDEMMNLIADVLL